ncbi:hypothetical protein Zmor_011059 [Zophobas morio]|uniref:Endonuclease/exonuclease/phosphatase domain-containing protein n=1 Tax=Zophobas morio TaxID=2755281 RepID=A0AA38IUA6_9CUCU|nr:hypothetical protein Zmor_011059 [Zophobas morio]
MGLIEIIQTNTDPGKAATTLIYKSIEESKIARVITAEPQKSLVTGNKWITDENRDAAVYIAIWYLIKNYESNNKRFTFVETRKIVYYSCYISPNTNNHDFEEYPNRLKISIKKHKKVVFARDLNAKSRVWGSKERDKRGRILLDWMAEMNLIIHNKARDPNFISQEGSSHIDLLTTTEKIGNQVKNWRITDHRRRKPKQTWQYLLQYFM